MDSFEFNKLIGALLGTVFVVFSVGIVSDAIFAAPASRKAGLRHRGGRGQKPAAAARPRRPRSRSPCCWRPPMPTAGAAVFKKCAACHTDEKGGPNKVGPNLWGIVNRPIASHEGFAYSAADEGVLPGRQGGLGLRPPRTTSSPRRKAW